MTKDRARPFSKKHRRYWIPVTGGMILIGLINLAIGFYLYAGAPKDAPRLSTAQVIDRHRATVAARLERATALHDRIAAAPATEAAPTGAASPVLVHLEDLVELAAPADDAPRVTDSRLLVDCAALLRDGRTTQIPAPEPPLAETLLGRCEQVAVLAVVRIRELVEPTDGTGSAAGDLLYVALDSGEVLGGFAWDTGAGAAHEQLTAEMRAALRRNLASRIDGAVRRRLAR